MLARRNGQAPHFHPRDDFNRRIAKRTAARGRIFASSAGRIGRRASDWLGPRNRARIRAASCVSLGIAGFKIPQWEFYHGRVVPGSEYERLSVATYCTHDHPPVRAMWEKTRSAVTTQSSSRRGPIWKKSRRSPDSNAPPSRSTSNAIFIQRSMNALFHSESWYRDRDDHRSAGAQISFQRPGHCGELELDRAGCSAVFRIALEPERAKRMQLIRELLEKTGRI